MENSTKEALKKIEDFEDTARKNIDRCKTTQEASDLAMCTFFKISCVFMKYIIEKDLKEL